MSLVTSASLGLGASAAASNRVRIEKDRAVISRAGLHLVVDPCVERDVDRAWRRRTGRSIGEWKGDWLETPQPS